MTTTENNFHKRKHEHDLFLYNNVGFHEKQGWAWGEGGGWSHVFLCGVLFLPNVLLLVFRVIHCFAF